MKMKEIYEYRIGDRTLILDRELSAAEIVLLNERIRDADKAFLEFMSVVGNADREHSSH